MITWIPKDKDQPKEKARLTDDGMEYTSSDIVLLWTTDKLDPVKFGGFEEGKWFVNGLFGHDEEVKYWAYINGPDGHLLQQEYKP